MPRELRVKHAVPQNQSDDPGNISTNDSEDDFEPTPQRRNTGRKKTPVNDKPSVTVRKNSKKTVVLEGFTQNNRQVSAVSLCTHMQNLKLGSKNLYSFEKTMKSCIIRNIKLLSIFKTASPFDRRITAIEWHPKLLTTFAVGSKGGDIIVWNHNLPKHEIFFEGLGAGGSINALKFDNEQGNHLYSCSIDGTVKKRDLRTQQSHIILDTLNCSINWFTALDVSPNGSTFAGDNKGFLYAVGKNNEFSWKKKLHGSCKITCIEFHKSEPWLFATASLDGTVKLWDTRQMKNKENSYLHSLPNQGPINSSFFSPSNGSRILTTDQHSGINVFSGPTWDLETRIIHPHRQFQHITPIKAYWHPLEDIIMVGRYPDPKLPGYEESDPRSVDFFDATDGQLMYQLESKSCQGLLNLNRFDSLGNVLLSASGAHILLWKPNFPERVCKLDEFEGPKKKQSRPRNRDSDDDDPKKKKSKQTKQKTVRNCSKTKQSNC